MNSSILKAVLNAQEKEDYEKAIELLTPLAKQGDAEAQFRLGDLYFTSADVSLEDSVKWLRLAAQQEHANALYKLASLRHLGRAGVPDTAEAVEFIKKAANKAVTEAQYALAVMYATGEDIAQDTALARRWYGEAAHAGNTTAQFEYGFMLLLGEGGPIDFETGRQRLEDAANSGEYQAAKLLAECYQGGLRGFPVDAEKAESWRSREKTLAREIRKAT